MCDMRRFRAIRGRSLPASRSIRAVQIDSGERLKYLYSHPRCSCKKLRILCGERKAVVASKRSITGKAIRDSELQYEEKESSLLRRMMTIAETGLNESEWMHARRNANVCSAPAVALSSVHTKSCLAFTWTRPLPMLPSLRSTSVARRLRTPCAVLCMSRLCHGQVL